MSKAKPGKSAVKVKSVIKDWHESLLNEDLRKDDYSFEVAMIVESSRLAFPTIENVISCGQSSDDVKPITKDDLIEFLISANHQDSKKEANLSNNLLKYASAEIKVNELTSESLAALIKLRMLNHKEVFIANRELMAKLKKEMEDDLKKLANPKAEGKGKGKDKKDKGKDKQGKGKSVQDLGDIYTQLHKDIDPDEFANKPKEQNLFRASFIQPDPNIITFFVLCQIYDLTVIDELSKLGVDVNLFMEIGVDYIYNMHDDLSDTRSIDSSEAIVNNFWDTWTNGNCEITEVLPQHTCYLKYIATDALSAEENFEDFKRILCNIDDFRRQYKNYYKNVRFINVKEKKQPIHLECLKIYNALLNQMPNECITIPFLLDSLVEEVAVRVDKCPPPDIVNEVPKIINKCHGGPSHQVQYLLKKYDCKLRYIPTPVKIPKTIHLIYGNVVEYISANIRPSKSVNDITLDAFKRFPPVNLFEIYECSNESDVLLYKYLFHKWSQQVENSTAKELKQCVYSFLFTRKHFNSLKLNCNRKSPNNSIKALMFAEDKSYNEIVAGREANINLNPLERKSLPPIQINVVTSVCSCRNFSPDNCSCHDVPEDYCNMAEELDSTALIQILTTTYDEYKHFDYKYFAPNDVILLRFHHNTNLNRIRTEECINSLRSIICFRDFCAFVLGSDTDWFVDQEHVFWEEKKAEEARKLEQRRKEFMEQMLCTGDNVIEGSIKDKKRKEEEALLKGGKKDKGKDKGSKKDKSDKGKKGKGGSKLSQQKPPEKTIVRTSEPCIPKSFPFYDPTKQYPFEIYNLGSNCLRSLDNIIEFHSVDGISVSIHKQRWSRKDFSCSFNITANNNSLVLHTTLNKILIADNPFQFHVNVANGIIMVFSKPTIEENSNSKHVISDIVQKKDPIDTIFSKSVHSNKTMSSDKYSSVRNSTLEYLKTAVQNQIPVFKIISSRLHKYQYVKRIKSQIEFPVGKILKRIICKPTLFLRLKKNKTVKESKCIPYTDHINNTRTELNLDWKATLPTGLLVQTVTAVDPYPFYIKQKYIIYRSDLKGIKDESYRCFLRNGTVMKFMKDGSIKTYTPDKNICHYKYGCFSSNTRKKTSIEELLNSLQPKKMKNIVPLHFYINNLTRLQKRIRKMCNRFKTHLIDVADNYRFESSREQCRKLHKVYKLSKKIYTDNTCMIPLLNYTIITSQGRIIDVKNNIVYDHEKRYQQMEYTDYLLNETVIHREDGTSWLINTNGTAVTQFADGTRITTWFTELDDNLIVEDTPPSSDKSTTRSIDKFCQAEETNNSLSCDIEFGAPFFDPGSNQLFQTDSDDDFSVLYGPTAKYEKEGFVLLGMNYMYEHPNFATVTYYCTDEITNIKMPDNVEVTADKEGLYTVNLLNNDSIEINDKTVEFKASNCKTCENKTCCKLNILPLIYGDAEETNNFLYIKDSSKRIFQVYFNGDISNCEEENPDLDAETVCSLHNSYDGSERYFVVNRDLSGEELYHEPIPYHFVHTLHDNKRNLKGEEEAILLEESCSTTVIQPLRKTYSEHLMMLYDLPILATTNEKRCIEKLWKLHDLDINTIIFKRKPLFTFKRLIGRLNISVMRALSEALAKCLSDGIYNVPDISIVERVSQTENELTAPVIVEPAKVVIPLKSKTVKALCDKYRKLIQEGEIPQYFDTLFGVMFTNVEECSEAAMESTGGAFTYTKFSEPKDDAENVPDVTEYPGIINVPQELTIHLKPDSYTHDIELTSTGIRITTENYMNEYPFPKSIEPSPRSKSVEIDEEVEEKLGEPSGSKLKERIKSDNKGYPVITKSTEGFEETYGEDEEEFTTTCDQHLAMYPICRYDICMCKNPLEKESTGLKKCRCITAICTCSKSRRSDSSITPACSMADDINIDFNNLTCIIIEYFKNSPGKLKVLQENVDSIIQTTAKALDMMEEDILNLIKNLKWNFINLPEKSESKKLTKDEMLDILFNIKSSLTDTATPREEQFNSLELDVIASSINMAITESRCGSNKSVIVSDVKCKLKETNLSPNEINEVISIVMQKVLTSKSLEDVEEHIAVPKLYRKFINELNKTIETCDMYKSCCDKCYPKKKTHETLRKSSDPSATYFCKKEECTTKRHVSTSIHEPKIIQINNLAQKATKNSHSDLDLHRKKKTLESFDTTKARKYKYKPSKDMMMQVKNSLEFEQQKTAAMKVTAMQEVEEPIISKEVIDQYFRPNIYDADYNRK